MSNAVYPTLPGLTHGQERTILTPPVQVRTTPAMREYRARDATLPRYAYTLPYEFLRSGAAWLELQTLEGFYKARGGEFESFLYLDRVDSVATLAAIGVGDGSTTEFPALRALGGFAEQVDAFVGTPSVYVDGVAQTAGSQFTVAAGSGVVTFASAPSLGAVLTWSGQFYRRVRFDMGQLQVQQFLPTLWTTKRVQLLSTRS